MSGLETLGVVCNIFQVIGFAHETVTLCKGVYQGRSPDDHLGQNAASLEALSIEIETYHQAHRPNTPAERKLSELASKCSIAARSLHEEVDFLIGQKAKGSLVMTLHVAAKINWRKNRLERLEKSLRDYQKTLETHLLADLCKRIDALGITQQEGFKTLETALQGFVTQIASGHTTLSELVNAQTLSIKRHSTKQALDSEKAIESHITNRISTAERSITGHFNTGLQDTALRITRDIQNLNRQAVTDAQRERALKSLKFPAMNERGNHIVESHAETFQWVLKSRQSTDFDGHTIESESSSSSGDSEVSDQSNSESEDESDEDTDDSSSDASSDSDDPDPLWDNFSDWLKSDSNLYWISGKPGSGKSTLVKFLTGNLLTKAALELWKPNTVILSHFFWKAGPPIQNNIKGLLCTLLYQVLDHDQSTLDILLSKTATFARKDADTDWSVEELKKALVDLLSSASRPSCIFIDGLDEICDDDGATALMRVIDDMRALPNVKLCVASRPEPRFLRRLCNEQHLRLQDLTADDMRHYAKDTLRPYIHAKLLPRAVRDQIVIELLLKAEGVFLWLRLAIGSLTRGLENGDGKDTLLQRLDGLPSELSRLYQDMWKRFNDDIPLYREASARYLNLIIDAADIHNKFGNMGNPYSLKPSPYYLGNGRLNVFQLMAATEEVVPAALIDKRGVLPEETLRSLCERAKGTTRLRCAGLVEIISHHHTKRIRDRWQSHIPNEQESIHPYLNMTVGFIHRTAYDFLRNSKDGYRLRAHDQSSRDERLVLLLRANLAQCRIFRDIVDTDTISRALNPLRLLHNGNQGARLREMLQVCWEWYDSGYLCYTRFGPIPCHRMVSPPHFLALALSAQFEDFVVSNIAAAPHPAILATTLLRDLCHEAVAWSHHMRSIAFEDPVHFFESAIRLMKPLLVLGADANLREASYKYDFYCRYPDGYEGSIHTTAFEQFLRVAFRVQPSPQLRHVPELLSRFLSTGLDRDASILLEIYSRFRSSRVDEPYVGLSGFPAPVDEDPRRKIVFKANVSYLIRALCIRASNQFPIGQASPELESILHSIEANSTSPPSVAVILVALDATGNGKPSFYRPLKQNSARVAAMVAALDMYLEGEKVGSYAHCSHLDPRKVLKDLENGVSGDGVMEEFERIGGRSYHRPDLFTFLAEQGCGYKIVQWRGCRRALEHDGDSLRT
ncbi:hypothetical protein B0T19DRAFT_434251 [Cercophora scortea]|uniref:NACHT domain-containing protein n=1 Tax=Cercophora scortea TaxID=314031 RepID=A0AAE0I8L3_9PEZI|nr:hypothetical protein B0T19DRAFT_434251 [Cercophora scortea]